MNIKLKENIIFGILCIFLLIPSVVYAHGMLLTLEEPGVLKVEYDGGVFTQNRSNHFDKDGNELGRGL